MSTNIATKSNSKSRQKSLHVKDKPTSTLIIKTDKVMIPVVIKKNKKQPEQHQQQQQKQIIVKLPNNNKNTPQQQQQQDKKRNILPVKARRVERRKEIKSMTAEAINDSSSSSSDENNDIKKKKKKQQQYKRTTVYAGPTFNNAPNPSTLPLPTLVSIKKQELQKHSQDLMNILSTQQTTSQFERDLSEIQRGLRSMLKI